MKKLLIVLIFTISIIFVSCKSKQEFVNQSSSSMQEYESTSIDVFPSVSPKSEGIISNSDTIKNSEITINEQDNGLNGTFYIDMTIEEAMEVIDELKIDAHSVEITSEPNDWEWGNTVLDSGNFSLSFNKEYRLYDISIYESTPTSMGLKVGDSLESMEKMYGKHYSIYEPQEHTGSQIYEYSIGRYFFSVLIRDNKVACWGISKYKFDNE